MRQVQLRTSKYHIPIRCQLVVLRKHIDPLLPPRSRLTVDGVAEGLAPLRRQKSPRGLMSIRCPAEQAPGGVLGE